MSTPRDPGASSPSVELVPGQTVAGKYAVTAHLGSGGMGDVFEVEHTLLGKRFALKRLSAEMSRDRAMVERFLREARAAAATGHAGIVDVVDLGFAEDGLPYLVMERLTGETLRRRLDRGPLDEAALVRLGGAVLGALAAVHAAGIIHRDIKPENLFLCSDGRVKVLDFGLSHRATADLRLTQSGAVMGTPLYMSPEQARGEDVDARTDVYAVGAVLYEAASGRPPFVAPAYSVLVAMILEIAPNPARLDHLSPRARAAILAALAKRCEDRPASAAAMREALGAREDDDAAWASSPALGMAETVAPASVPPPPLDDLVRAPTVLTPPETPRAAGAGVHGVGAAAPVAGSVPVPAAAAAAVPATVADAVAAAVPVPVAVADAVAAAVPATAAAGGPGAAVPVVTAGRARRVVPWVVAGAAALGGAAVLLAGRSAEAPRPPAPASAPAAPAVWAQLVLDGDLERAADAARVAAARAPDDVELATRDLLLALLEDRTRAYARVRDLDARALPAPAAAVVAAVRAVQAGEPVVGADALAAALAAAPPGSLDELLVRHARASLLLMGGDTARARADWEDVLRAWPAFAPAVEELLQPLLYADDVAAARAHLDAYLAASPPSEVAEMLEIELLIGERRYRDALDRIERLIAADPGRDAEAYQFRGDLRVLLDDPIGAIAAYAPIEDDLKRDHYVAGALAHQGRTAEARALLVDAIARFPRDAKPSRLGKLVTDAALLALETADPALADVAAGALAGRDVRRLELPVQGAVALARGVRDVLAGRAPDPFEFPLGAASPAYVVVAVHGRAGDDALAQVRAATDRLALGVAPTHVFPALFLERARLEPDPAVALAWVERVVRPRHYDTARGAVYGRAVALQADLLDRLGRGGEAEAVRRAVTSRRSAPASR